MTETKTMAQWVAEYNHLVEEASSLGMTGYKPVGATAFKTLEVAARRCEAIASSIRAFRDGQAAAQSQPEENETVSKGNGVKRKKFRGIRDGTALAKIVLLCDGTHTVAEIARRVGANSPVTAHLACMKRAHGIDYDLNDGKPRLKLPRGRTVADLVK